MLLQTQLSSDSINNPIVEEKTLSIIELISAGGIGGNIIMGTLGVLSIYAIYILIERYSTIKKASIEDESFLKSIRNFVEHKDIQAAKTLCKNTDNPVSRMIEKGIDRIDKPMTDISAAIENQGKLEVYKMESNLANLATMAGAAPMIGFLGTVIGMILVCIFMILIYGSFGLIANISLIANLFIVLSLNFSMSDNLVTSTESKMNSLERLIAVFSADSPYKSHKAKVAPLSCNILEIPIEFRGTYTCSILFLYLSMYLIFLFFCNLWNL